MKRLLLCATLLLAFTGSQLPAQGLRALSSPTPKPAATPAAAEKKDATGEKKDPLRGMFGGGVKPGEPITTEIYADEAFFDSQNSIGVFSGRVIVKDPRFNLQADKLTIYLSKGEPGQTGGRGLEKAVAEGNVGVVREQPGENGQPPNRSVGRADSATYTIADGSVELKGSPRVQNGPNTHVATSPETTMTITQTGQLTTRGPSRTEIRQEPKPPEPPKP